MKSLISLSLCFLALLVATSILADCTFHVCVFTDDDPPVGVTNMTIHIECITNGAPLGEWETGSDSCAFCTVEGEYPCPQDQVVWIWGYKTGNPPIADTDTIDWYICQDDTTEPLILTLQE